MTAAVEVVVLDLGGVACEFVPTARLHALRRLTGMRSAEIHEALFASDLEDRAERGDLGVDEVYAAIADALGVPVEPDAVRQAWSRAFVPASGLLAMVRRVYRPTALFTNNGPLIEDCLAHELSEVTTAFDRLLVSWRLGSTKPQPDAFAKATAALGTEPGLVLFVDDSLGNVAAAEDFGWQAHQYRGTCDLNDVFVRHGLFERAETG